MANEKYIFNIPRGNEFEFVFSEFLNRSGFDSYGSVVDNFHLDLFNKADYGFENDVFALRPFYWGDDESMSSLPNFQYKKDGTQISWYKYPFRSAYATRELTIEDFIGMLAECERSLDEAFGGKERVVTRLSTKQELDEEFEEFRKVIEHEAGDD